MQPLSDRQSLYCCYFLIADSPHASDARAPRRPVNQHGTRAALPLAATVLASREAQLVSQHKEQALLRIGADTSTRSVYIQLSDGRHPNTSLPE
jgi:hypothetical protein